MFAEELHSLDVTACQGLFVLGRTLSRQPPDANHPFGYGKDALSGRSWFLL
jgi:divalent metal cation (Fe/Co/Zn/Cd) transporter